MVFPIGNTKPLCNAIFCTHKSCFQGVFLQQGLPLKHIYLLRALRMLTVYAPSPPVCYVGVRIYLYLSFPAGTESKCNIGKQERYCLCLHYQASETRTSWIPCLVYPHLRAAGDNRSSTHCQIFTCITCTCSYCAF